MLTAQQLDQLLALASEAALAAGRYIAEFSPAAVQVSHKDSGSSEASSVVTQVDLACEALIQQQLSPSFEALNIAFLGEESAANYPVEQHPRLSSRYFWCVDPLDGTLAFSQGTAGYAVSIALVDHGGKPVLGVVYDPVSRCLYQGVSGFHLVDGQSRLHKQGKAWFPLDALQAQKPLPLSVYFDRSFTQDARFHGVADELQQLARHLGYAGVELHHQAGAVMNAVQVLESAPACYFKLPKSAPGGGSLWDFSATAVFFEAAGAWVSDIQGNPLALNGADSLFMNRRGVLFASDSAIAQGVTAIAKSASRGERTG